MKVVDLFCGAGGAGYGYKRAGLEHIVAVDFNDHAIATAVAAGLPAVMARVEDTAAWLPDDDDRAHVLSLMTGVSEPGKMAGWVAAPSRGIHQKPVDYEYVRV